MTRMRLFLVVALAAAIAAGAAAQSSANEPGRIQLALGGLAKRAAEVSDVTLDGPMLQVGLRMLSQQEGGDQAARALAGLQGVYVQALHFDGTGEYSESDLADILRQLRTPGWSRVLSVDSRHERRKVDVYVKTTARGVAGMAIIAEYPNELRVVNLVGPIDPAALSHLGGHFGIPLVQKDRNEHDNQ